MLSLLVTVATMVVGTVILEARGEATLGLGGLADVLWRNLAVAALLGPLGVAFGALIRNQIVTVVGLIALAAVLEPAVLQVAPDVGRFGPLAGAPCGDSREHRPRVARAGHRARGADRLDRGSVRGGGRAAAPPRSRLIHGRRPGGLHLP